MYIFKQPRIGGEVTCHQDSTFLYTEPIAIAGLWFALEDATVENGCLWAVPGGRRLGLRSRWLRASEGGMRFEVFDSAPWPEQKLVPPEVKKGNTDSGARTAAAQESGKQIVQVATGVHAARHRRQLPLPAGQWLQRSPALPFRGFD
jgi:phytanoyl-CoA hydroxylase